MYSRSIQGGMNHWNLLSSLVGSDAMSLSWRSGSDHTRASESASSAASKRAGTSESSLTETERFPAVTEPLGKNSRSARASVALMRPPAKFHQCTFSIAYSARPQGMGDAARYPARMD